jgi:hypothetical protein
MAVRLLLCAGVIALAIKNPGLFGRERHMDQETAQRVLIVVGVVFVALMAPKWLRSRR